MVIVDNNMKTNKYHTVGTILNSNRERRFKASQAKTDQLLVIAFGLSSITI